MDSVRLYDIMRVNKATLHKTEKGFTLVTEYHCFKTNYISHIPITLENEEWEKLKAEPKTYKGAKSSPILHKIKKQAIDYLKRTNRLQT